MAFVDILWLPYNGDAGYGLAIGVFICQITAVQHKQIDWLSEITVRRQE